jgi:predicted kinase
MNLLVIRGLPGSGKTTLAHTLSPHVFAADDYFMVNGEYQYDRSKISLAHTKCYEDTTLALKEKRPLVIVTNVFQKKHTIARYAKLASECGYKFFVVDLFDQNYNDMELAARNVHRVPIEEIARMRRDWEF